MDLPQPQNAPASMPPPAAYRIDRPTRQTAPLVFASPHSGRGYPSRFLDLARLDATALRRSEDCFVDELFSGAVGAGAPLVAATFARAYCDPNREPWELDPAMFDEELPDWVNTTSARVGAGLGTLARVVASGEAIYRRKLSFEEAEYRVHHYWTPYHGALRGLLDGTCAAFGTCLLIDCHSMPAQSCGSRSPVPDIVLGDAHGTACTPAVTQHAERLLAGMGLKVRRNDPYAGGYVTRHYGRPREGVHALQIEVARSLYMDEGRFSRSSGFAALQQTFGGFAMCLARDVAGLLAG